MFSLSGDRICYYFSKALDFSQTVGFTFSALGSSPGLCIYNLNLSAMYTFSLPCYISTSDRGTLRVLSGLHVLPWCTCKASLPESSLLYLPLTYLILWLNSDLHNATLSWNIHRYCCWVEIQCLLLKTLKELS